MPLLQRRVSHSADRQAFLQAAVDAKATHFTGHFTGCPGFGTQVLPAQQYMLALNGSWARSASARTPR